MLASEVKIVNAGHKERYFLQKKNSKYSVRINYTFIPRNFVLDYM